MKRVRAQPLSNLRLRERARDGATVRGAARQESDALRQMQLLEVTQLELEQQSVVLEALLRRRDVATENLQLYAELYEQAPVAYFSLSSDGLVTRANLAAARLLGQPRTSLLGQSFEQFIEPDGQPALRQFLQGVGASGARGALELRLRVAGACEVRIVVSAELGGDGCCLVMSELGDRHERELARRLAFQVLDSIEEGVLVCDGERRIVAVNPAFSRLSGYQAEQAIGRDPAFLGRPGGHPPGYHRHAMEQLCAQGIWQGEVHNLRRDGTPYLAAMSLTVLRDAAGAITHLIGVFSDITERKRAEHAQQQWSLELDARVGARTAELTAANRRLQQEVAERKRAEQALHESREQLRRLADHLATLKEDERKQIARDIHDELGQNLLALRIDVSMLRARTEARHPRLHERASAVLDNVDSSIRSVRGIMNELRPTVLDLGLQAAIEWQVGQFRQRSGLECVLLLPDDGVFAAIPSGADIVLFRSLQEALSNIMRHAHASQVLVRLDAARGWLQLTVSDNGIGIAPRQRGGSSFGLIGIAERVAALGGRFEISPYLSGQGGCLTMRFPLLPA